MKPAHLESEPSFALLAPGYTGSSTWTLLRDLHPDDGGELVFLPYEARTPERYRARHTEHPDRIDLEPTLSPAVEFAAGGYPEAVEAIREAIASGDVYQVCLTLRARVIGVGGSELFSALCRHGPSPYAAWVRFPDGRELVSASPELLLGREGDTVRSEPMKGTARVGEGRILRASEKDRAELAMITDLVRNDLTPVCRPRSIRVVDDRRSVQLPYAVQTVSVIEGELAEGRSDLDALAALHPGGSVTGAPKVAALQMIQRLEPTPRGAYCGSLGLRTEARARHALLIRTAHREADQTAWTYGVGSGVVYDSSAEAEWAELRVKLNALAEEPS